MPNIKIVCLRCGRDRFDKAFTPHRCGSNYFKHRLTFGVIIRDVLYKLTRVKDHKTKVSELC